MPYKNNIIRKNKTGHVCKYCGKLCWGKICRICYTKHKLCSLSRRRSSLRYLKRRHNLETN